MVTKVTRPPRTSRATVEPRRVIEKYRSTLLTLRALSIAMLLQVSGRADATRSLPNCDQEFKLSHAAGSGRVAGRGDRRRTDARGERPAGGVHRHRAVLPRLPGAAAVLVLVG